LSEKTEILYRKRIHFFDEDFFEDINTEEKAYWLGFLYGDGCVRSNLRSLAICLKSSDKNHLEKLQKSLKSNYKIYECKDRPVVYLSINSTKLVRDLVNLGCVPNKSQKDLHIPRIESELQRHFIRGYMDADGCVRLKGKYKYISVWFSGCKTLISEIFDYFFENGIVENRNKIRISPLNNRTHEFNYCSAPARQILDYLYNDCTICLDRKYKIYKRC